MLSNLIKWHKIGVKPYQMLSHVIKSCQSLWLYDILWNLIYPNPNPSLCIYYTSFYFMWKTCNTCALTCQHHSTKPLLVPFFAVAPLGTDGGTDSAAEVLKTGTKFGYAHDLLELGEDDQRRGWENSHVIIGLLWFTMAYFMLFHFFLKILWIQRFLKMSNDFKRWDLGDIWLVNTKSHAAFFFFTCDFWVKFSLKALRYCNSKKWCGDSAQLLYLCGFPCTLKFWPGPM